MIPAAYSVSKFNPELLISVDPVTFGGWEILDANGEYAGTIQKSVYDGRVWCYDAEVEGHDGEWHEASFRVGLRTHSTAREALAHAKAWVTALRGETS